jgi:hypothetical protein
LAMKNCPFWSHSKQKTFGLHTMRLGIRHRKIKYLSQRRSALASLKNQRVLQAATQERRVSRESEPAIALYHRVTIGSMRSMTAYSGLTF